MKYQVFWRATARDHLAAIWKGDTDRNAIAESVASIEDVLEIKPATAGEQRSDNQRILVQGPLACVYQFDEGKQRVTVLSVRLLPGQS